MDSGGEGGHSSRPGRETAFRAFAFDRPAVIGGLRRT